jgi:hypothetical protein
MTFDHSRSTSALDHLRRVIADEAVTAPEQPLHRPEPHDPRLRVHRALVLLADGTSVTDTAAACGWATTSQCIEQFTPLVGMTPGRYRLSQLTV